MLSMRKATRWVFLTSKRAAWAPILVFSVHVILLRVFHIYDPYPALDIPMHFLGGVAIAYFLRHTLVIAVELGALGMPNRHFVLLAAFALACTSTIVWEFAEFLLDRRLGTRAQLGLEDTLGDMLMGMIGAAVLLIPHAFRGAGARGKTDAAGFETGEGRDKVPEKVRIEEEVKG